MSLFITASAYPLLDSPLKKIKRIPTSPGTTTEALHLVDTEQQSANLTLQVSFVGSSIGVDYGTDCK